MTIVNNLQKPRFKYTINIYYRWLV